MPFKTAEALGIEEWERDALIELIPDLCSNKVRLAMVSPWSCIGGIVGKSSKAPDDYTILLRTGLHALYFPRAHEAYTATCFEAADAITYFLGGEPRCWEKVYEKSQKRSRPTNAF